MPTLLGIIRAYIASSIDTLIPYAACGMGRNPSNKQPTPNLEEAKKQIVSNQCPSIIVSKPIEVKDPQCPFNHEGLVGIVFCSSQRYGSGLIQTLVTRLVLKKNYAGKVTGQVKHDRNCSRRTFYVGLYRGTRNIFGKGLAWSIPEVSSYQRQRR